MVRAAMVALLVACSLVVTAAGGAPALQPPHSPPPEQSSRLAWTSQHPQVDSDRATGDGMLGPGAPSRSTIATHGVDVSAAVTVQRERADGAIDRRALEVAFERTEDDQARRELLFEAATDVEIAISGLRSDRRDLRGDYVNGTITVEAYARERTLADARAEQLRSDLDLIQELADRIPQFSMRSRVGTLKAPLLTFDGPVSSQVGSAIRGEEGEIRLYLAVSRNGSTTSTIEDDHYVRETSRSDLWTPDTAVVIGFDEVITRVGEVYPKFNTSETSGGIGTLGPDGTDLAAAGLYRINIRYVDRTTTAYLDGDTRNVFYEVQSVRLASMEPGPPISATDNGTGLVVNRTYDGGPLRIATVDNGTRAPTDVPVLVDGTRYRTGSDGVVWAISPAGRTRVVAVGEAGNVSVEAVPLRSSELNASPIE